MRQFLDHTPVRRYLAVLRGRLGVEAVTLVHYFGREGMHQQPRPARDPGRLVPNFDIPSNALLRMLRSSGLSLSTRARERASRLTANCPPIFSIWFKHCHDRAVRAREHGVRLAIEMMITSE